MGNTIFANEGQVKGIALAEESIDHSIKLWLLGGGAFVLIMACTGGCCFMHKALQGLLEAWRAGAEQLVPRPEVIGFCFVILGAQLGAFANAIRQVLGNLPLLQIMQARFLLQCACSVGICCCLRYYGYPIHIFGQPGKRILVTARAWTFSAALGFMWAALSYLPVGEATAIVYFSPIVTAVLARAVLGESFGCVFMTQGVVSCLGVLLVVGDPVPGASNVSSQKAHAAGVLLGAASCMCFACGSILMRLLKDVHPMEVQVFQDLLTALVFLPGAQVFAGGFQLLDWSMWGLHEAILLAAFTACGLAGSFALIVGFGLSPAGKAAPFVYTELCSAFALQVYVFSQFPGYYQIVGAGLIVVAAVCRMWYELHLGELEAQEVDAPTPFDRLVSPLPSPLLAELHSGQVLGPISAQSTPEISEENGNAARRVG